MSKRAAGPRTKPKTKSKSKTRRRPSPRRRRSSKAPKQSELWPQRRYRGVAERAPDIIRAAIRQTGRRMISGAFNDAPPPPPAKHALLVALEASPDIRRSVGRIDISGATDAAAWASIERKGSGLELVIFYRHGREVCADLARAAAPLIAEQNFTVGGLGMDLRQRGNGAWAAVFPLSPSRALSITRGRGLIMVR